jgi:hypothetical protein
VLRREDRPDSAAIFLLTHMPGSRDTARIDELGSPLDQDLYSYDTFHPVMDHPKMSREEWFALYQEAWGEFYTFDHLKGQLARVDPEQHTTLLQMYFWYKSATAVDRFHPMMTGFWRLKPRKDRRPGHAAEGRVTHVCRRVPEVCRTAWRSLEVLRLIKRLWVETRRGSRHDLPLQETASGFIRTSRQIRDEAQRWGTFLREMFGPPAPLASKRDAFIDFTTPTRAKMIKASTETIKQP